MEFKQAMRALDRMCNVYESACNGCPLDGNCPFAGGTDFIAMNCAIEKWAAEHPERTIADDFFEKHPKAQKNKADLPIVCAAHCGYIDECPNEYSRLECEKCWRRPLEEVE